MRIKNSLTLGTLLSIPLIMAGRLPVDYVNPMIGTAPLEDLSLYGGPNYDPDPEAMYFTGTVFPGSTMPFGMVQLSPICSFEGAPFGSGYNYTATSIMGFAHTNMGHWQYGNILFMPTVGAVQLAPGSEEQPDLGYRSRFSHDNEKAGAGYYQVYLEDYDINVELSSTTRAGFHRYRFPKSAASNVVIDLGRCFRSSSESHVEFKDQSTLSGWQKSRASAGDFTLYFHAEFSKPFLTQGTWNGTRRARGNEDAPVKNSAGAYVSFNTDEGEELLIKVGLSFISLENAKANLDLEIPHWDFERTREEARRAWSEKLKIIQIEGGSEAQRTNFYTSLYRALQWPHTRSDADGTRRLYDGTVTKESWTHYGLPPMWDTFWNKQPLLNLILPEIKRNILRGLSERAIQKGWYDTYFHGNHAASIVATSYLSGIRDFDVETAYEYLKKNQTQMGGPLQYLDEYLNQGYVSTEDPPPAQTRTPGKSAVAKTLEYAFNDYCMALLAQALGKDEDYAMFMARSKNYANVFDTERGFVWGKRKDGSWIEPFYPMEPYHTYLFREGNAWQNIWSVPHDFAGLTELMGGHDAMVAKLDDFFRIPYEPEGTLYDVAGMIGQYNHGNQPDHHAPYIYSYLGQPWKTQELVRDIMDKMYRGLVYTGMDDCGEMASWYVWSAIGCYPVCPPDLRYAIGSPLFDKVTINLPSLHGGKTLTIETRDNSEVNKYIQSATWNGQSFDSAFLSFEQLSQGGHLVFEMGSRPNWNWAAPQ